MLVVEILKRRFDQAGIVLAYKVVEWLEFFGVWRAVSCFTLQKNNTTTTFVLVLVCAGGGGLV